MNLEIDHLAVSADTLAEAVAHVEAALGVAMGPGGAHPRMGTHNRLMSLGPGVYLEAIAIDPAAEAPRRPRWFYLDARAGPARLSNWIVRCDGLEAALAQAPPGAGAPMALERDDLTWTMAVPPDGRLPFAGACPALIEWQGPAHPADRLPQGGCALKHLEVLHPDIEALLAGFPALAGMDGVTFLAAPAPRLRATIATPFGLRVLT
ncbi:MAG: VOC family protein [Alphaproteobacteria bacterium]|nr:VOC family protein [Alphaproteobacteria bacterium]